MNTTVTRTIEALIAHVVSECSTIDREQAFDEMLNECYDFSKVGGPFEYLRPSDVLKEMDETGYRCGVNDYADGQGWEEIDGDYYDSGDVETARHAFIDELNDELSDMESELEDMESEDEPESATAGLQARIDSLSAFIAECERYQF